MNKWADGDRIQHTSGGATFERGKPGWSALGDSVVDKWVNSGKWLVLSDEPVTFNPGDNRAYLAALIARSDEDRLLAVLDYLAEPRHRAQS